VLGRDLKENDEREDYLRASLTRREDGTLVATPFPLQDSSMLVPARGGRLPRHPHTVRAARQGRQPCVFVKLQD